MNGLLANEKEIKVDLHKFMSADECETLNVNMLTQKQCEALLQWGMKMFRLGQHVVSTIDEIKYDGRLIVLEDGSKWEVNSIDSSIAESWSQIDNVVVIDDKMYNLENVSSIEVKEELL